MGFHKVLSWAPYCSQSIHLIYLVFFLPPPQCTLMTQSFIHNQHEQSPERHVVRTTMVRGQRGDLIITFRALRNLFGVDLQSLFSLNFNHCLRGHSYKLYRENFRSSSRQHLFSNRVFLSWNRFPEDDIE